MTIKETGELEALSRIGAVVANVRDAMIAAVVPGVTTAQLDAIGRDALARHGARSAPQLAYGFPGATCIGRNGAIAHGIPSAAEVLREGDLVNIDVSAELDGFWADTGASVPVGTVSAQARELLEATKAALDDALRALRPGAPLRNVGRAVESRARLHGFHVIRNLAGHGIGRHIHEDPQVPNVYDPENRERAREGLVLAVEPFLSTGSRLVVEDGDGWTLRTADGGLAAQFEHTVVVMTGGVRILTA